MHADSWAIKAKQLGLRSRAVFKLEEILSKTKALKKGANIVLDIGSAPGGWSELIKSLSPFVDMIKSFEIFNKKNDAYTCASHIASTSGLLKELYNDKSIEGISRFENIQELLNSIKEFVDNPENNSYDLDKFLQEISLMTNSDSEDDSEEEYISLMTIHMAKGLEFPVVFVVGVEEDLFPSQMMITTREDLEEERRLFYVAITRSMKKLYLTYSTTRYRYGMLKDCQVSRFIKEINPIYLESDYNQINKSFVKNVINEKKRNIKPISKIINNKFNTSFQSSDINELKEGVLVQHPSFGKGEVLKIEIDSNQKKATVKFNSVGEKTLLLNYAKLRIVK